MPDLISEIEKVISGNFPEGETNVKDLIDVCSLCYITVSRNVYILKKIIPKDVEELAGICFFKGNVIYSFAVSTEFQRQGYGKRLLKGIILHLKDIDIIVRANNSGAISMYEKSGFVATGIKRDFYNFTSLGDDGISMSVRKK